MLPLIQRLRRHSTLTVCLGMLAIWMQLAASGISAHHWLQAQMPSSLLGSICSTTNGNTPSTGSSNSHQSGLMQLHCAACVVASQALITPATPLLTWAPNLMKVGNFRIRFQPCARSQACATSRAALRRLSPFYYIHTDESHGVGTCHTPGIGLTSFKEIPCLTSCLSRH